MNAKGRAFRNQAYMAYVREQRPVTDWEPMATCPLRYQEPCNATYPRVAHHIRMGGQGGMGLKPSDYRTVSMDAIDHSDLHNRGEKGYWASKEIDPHEACITLMVNYVKDRRKLMNILEDLIESER